ncbi:hypothetical protein [Paraburkholderia atlantica]|uniref:hypothetical protein n=1 Tax=Paraburkholderia atlantica TaxID=2654982 RepID=UPI000372C503|nr:hypothetical protein [Paraburkholderia atlantica]
MPAGLQCWDENGNLIFDATYRVLRIIGAVNMTGESNSLQDNRLKQGGFVSFQPNNTCGDGYLSGGVIIPQFSIDPNTGILSWSYTAKHSSSYDIYQVGTLFYGAS